MNRRNSNQDGIVEILAKKYGFKSVNIFLFKLSMDVK